jgi:hypothetical protein
MSDRVLCVCVLAIGVLAVLFAVARDFSLATARENAQLRADLRLCEAGDRP